MGSKEHGFQVTIHRFETASLFFGYKDDYQVKEQDFSDLCCYLASEHYSFEPEKDLIVGVRSQKRNKWVRARIENIYLSSKKTEYKVLLIDYGVYETVTKQQMVVLNELAKYPPQCLIIGLEDVLPVVTLSKEHKEFFSNIFKQGQIYFKANNKICNIGIGNIFIKPYDNTPTINLTTLLLDEHFVKVTNNFEEDLKRFYKAFDWFEENYCSPSKEERKVKHQSIELKNKVTDNNDESDSLNISESSTSSSNAGTSTGYSSSDELNELLMVPEGAVFVPAGYQIPHEKTPHNSRIEEVKKTRTYYERRAELQRSRSLTRVKDNSKGGTDTSQRSKSTCRPGVRQEGKSFSNHRSMDQHNDITKKEPNRGQKKEHISRYNSLSESTQNEMTFKPKCVSWGDDNTYKEKTLSKVDHTARAFNFNFKTEENKRKPNENTSNTTTSCADNTAGASSIQETSVPCVEHGPNSKKTLCSSNVSSAHCSVVNSLSSKSNSILSDSGESSISSQNCSKLSIKKKLLRLKYKTEEAVVQPNCVDALSEPVNADKIIETVQPNCVDALSEPKDSLKLKCSLNESNYVCDRNVTNDSSSRTCDDYNTSIICENTSSNISDGGIQTANVNADSSVSCSLNISGLSKKKRLQLKYKEELAAKLQGNDSGNSSSSGIDLQTSSISGEQSSNSLDTSNTSAINSNGLGLCSSDKSHQNYSLTHAGSAGLSKRKRLQLKYKNQCTELQSKEHLKTENIDSLETSEKQIMVVSITNNQEQNYNMRNLGKISEERIEVETPASISASKKDSDRISDINSLMAPTAEDKGHTKYTNLSLISTDSSDPEIQRLNACSVLVHAKSGQIVRPISRLSESGLNSNILKAGQNDS